MSVSTLLQTYHNALNLVYAKYINITYFPIVRKSKSSDERACLLGSKKKEAKETKSPSKSRPSGERRFQGWLSQG